MLERPPGGFLTFEVCTANGIFEMRYHLTTIVGAIGVVRVVEVSRVNPILLK